MATKLEALIAQQTEIAKQIQDLKDAERKPILDELKAKIKEYGFTVSELGLKGKKTIKAYAELTEKKIVVPMYRNEKNEEWAGRGKPPKWMAGADGKISPALKTKYAIKK